MSDCQPSTIFSTSTLTSTVISFSTTTARNGLEETVTLTDLTTITASDAVSTVTCASSSSTSSSSSSSTTSSSSTSELPSSSSETPSSSSTTTSTSISSSSTISSTTSSPTVFTRESTNAAGVVITVTATGSDTLVTSTSSPASKTPAIIGGAVGGGIGLILLLALLFGLAACIKRRKRDREEKAGLDIFGKQPDPVDLADGVPPETFARYPDGVERQPTISTMATSAGVHRAPTTSTMASAGLAGFGTSYVNGQDEGDYYQQPPQRSDKEFEHQQHQQAHDANQDAAPVYGAYRN